MFLQLMNLVRVNFNHDYLNPPFKNLMINQAKIKIYKNNITIGFLKIYS